MDTNYQDWTSCEMYGHDFVTDEDDPTRRYCTSCTESYRTSSAVGTDANQE